MYAQSITQYIWSTFHWNQVFVTYFVFIVQAQVTDKAFTGAGNLAY